MTKPTKCMTAGAIALVMALRTGPSLAAPGDFRQTPVPVAASSGPMMQPPPAVARLEIASRADVSGPRAVERVQPHCPEPGVSRHSVERIMHHEDPAIHQALIVLGEPVNPVRVVAWEEIRAMYARTPGAGAPPAGLDAFRAPGNATDPNIYVNRDSRVYTTAARKPSALALLKLAATLAHEQVHNTEGEAAAYQRQSEFVRSRLKSIPWRHREKAQRYLEGLEARAHALERAGSCPTPSRQSASR